MAFSNSERRISRVRAAVAAPGEARHDWAIATDFAHRLEKLLDPLAKMATLFPYSLIDEAAGVEAIWNEHRESTRGRDLDITGMSYAMLDAGPQQWPLKMGDTVGKVRLYEDGIFPTADGKARFVNTIYKPVAEPRESRYPFSLTTGRLRDQWHGMTRTGTVGRLFGHVAEPSVQMNAQDMARRLLKDGDLVYVTSKRGAIVVPLQASPEVAVSQAFIAMHWGAEYLSGLSSAGEPLAGVNAITTSAYCPTSKQPELKHAAVKILKAELPWSLLAMAWLSDTEVLTARERLKALMKAFPFTSCTPFSNNTPLVSSAGEAGRERTGILFRASAHQAPDEAMLVSIENILGLKSSDTLHYVDRKKGQRRTVRLHRVNRGGSDHAELLGFALSGDTSAEAWIKTLLQDELPAQAYGRQLLLPGAKPPAAVTDSMKKRGKLVCTCLNVTDAAIDEHLDSLSQGINLGASGMGSLATDESRLASLQGTLKCGTNCGSCVPELKRMVRSNRAPASHTPPRVAIPIGQVA